MEIEIKKMFAVKLPVIVQTVCMIKKETDKHIIRTPGSGSLHEIQKLHFAELIISFGEYYQCHWKISFKNGEQKK